MVDLQVSQFLIHELLAAVTESNHEPGAGITVNTGDSTRGKNKVIASYLSLFLGALGVHHFYLGSWGVGVTYLGITTVAFCAGGSILGIIAGVVDYILLLQMSAEDFDKQFNDRCPRPYER